MELLLENPFRVLGLPPTATERIISKRASDLSMYLEMGKEKEYENDFSFLSPIKRTKETVERAVQQIELADQKLMHSIFWFHSGNSVDEIVFELLNEGNVSKAIELWEKSVNSDGYSIKNISSHKNLALLQIHQSSAEYGINVNDFLAAAKLFIRTIRHESMLDYVSQVGGTACRISLVDLQKYFSNELHKILFAKASSVNADGLEGKFISIFDGSDDNVIQHVRSKFIEEPIHRLEGAISECSNAREFDESKIMIAAEKLHKKAGKLLKKLEASITKSDMHYQFIADKVAKELLACSTGYFNWGQEDINAILLLEQSEKITKWAKSFSQSSDIKSAVNDDLQTIKKLKKKQECEKHVNNLALVLNALPALDNLSRAELNLVPTTMLTFIDNCQISLILIEQIDKSVHNEYSSLIVTIVLAYCIEYSNTTEKFTNVISVLNKVKQFEMSSEVRRRFNSNFNILTTNQANISSSSGGCYIATLVYGSYDAPGVLELRSFRDDRLATTWFGRLFIKTYYSISPSLVRILKKQYFVQRIIRKILNKFIKSLTQ